MRLDYSHARMNFHATARSCEGYRPAYRLLFATLIDELETKNQYLSEHGCMLRVDFEAMIRFTGQNRKTFYGGLNWLHAHGFIGYGDTNKDTGIMQILCLPVAGSSAQSVSVTASVPVEMVTATVTGPAPGLVTNPVTKLVTPVVTNPVTKLVTPVVTEIVTDPLTGTNPPPHPPIEEKNNINTTATTAAAEAEGVVFPENISLEDWQISSLMKKEPVAVLNEALFMLSGIKAAKGTLMPDYYCLTDFVITSAKKRMSQPARADPAPLPVSVSGILPRPRSKQPD